MRRLQCDAEADGTATVHHTSEPEWKDALSSVIKPILMAIASDCPAATWEDSCNIYREVTLPRKLRDDSEVDICIQNGHIFIRTTRPSPVSKLSALSHPVLSQAPRPGGHYHQSRE
jgi:hypothetical protein